MLINQLHIKIYECIFTFNSPSELFFKAAKISFHSAPFLNLHVRSTTLTFKVGTLKAIPVSFPLSSGITNPTALAAPVLLGIIFPLAALPPLQSFPPLDGPSTTN